MYPPPYIQTITGRCWCVLLRRRPDVEVQTILIHLGRRLARHRHPSLHARRGKRIRLTRASPGCGMLRGAPTQVAHRRGSEWDSFVDNQSHLRVPRISFRSRSGLAARQRQSPALPPLLTNMRISIGSAFGALALAFLAENENFVLQLQRAPQLKQEARDPEARTYDYFILGALLLCNNAHMAGTGNRNPIYAVGTPSPHFSQAGSRFAARNFAGMLLG